MRSYRRRPPIKCFLQSDIQKYQYREGDYVHHYARKFVPSALARTDSIEVREPTCRRNASRIRQDRDGDREKHQNPGPGKIRGRHSADKSVREILFSTGKKTEQQCDGDQRHQRANAAARLDHFE